MDGLYEQFYHISVFFFQSNYQLFLFHNQICCNVSQNNMIIFYLFQFSWLVYDIYIYMESFLLKRDLQLRTSLHSHLSHKS